MGKYSESSPRAGTSFQHWSQNTGSSPAFLCSQECREGASCLGEAQRSVTQVRALAVVTGTDGTCVQGRAPERTARAPPTATVHSRAKSQAPFPDVLRVGGRRRPQPSVIHEDGFSLKTFSKGFPCSVSFAVPATVTKVHAVCRHQGSNPCAQQQSGWGREVAPAVQLSCS